MLPVCLEIIVGNMLNTMTVLLELITNANSVFMYCYSHVTYGLKLPSTIVFLETLLLLNIYIRAEKLMLMNLDYLLGGRDERIPSAHRLEPRAARPSSIKPSKAIKPDTSHLVVQRLVKHSKMA